ncbi:MAG: EF-P lysine aminoacylase GenX [Planctomycetes bacterium]|nr:EF-P lysine aminoacylase GenX [Planctomycetota bacterium]
MDSIVHPIEWRPSATVETLRRRAEMVEAVRGFFAQRGVLEVDTPVLQGGANLDPGISPQRIQCHDGERFLPTSPEHPLKRLVAAGYGPVWTLAPAFRRGELGRRHGPEFRMLEWYRPGWDERQLMHEVLALLAAIGGWTDEHEVVDYHELFARHLDIDPATVGIDRLVALLGSDGESLRDDREAALDLLLATRIEPHLGRGRFTVVCDYPPHLAAQAQVRSDGAGRRVAARFEIYREGVELANGYRELTDASELAARLERELTKRGAEDLRRDQRFEAAMSAGLPECAGVAVGFDRVVMLALGLSTVAQTQAFDWLHS